MLTEDQKEHIKKFGIAITHEYPSYFYVVSVHENSMMPTDDELEQIQVYRDTIIKRIYNDSYGKKMLSLPIPGDSGHNTTIFLKGGRFEWSPLRTEGWTFRKATWTEGPAFLPDRMSKKFKPQELVEIIKRAI